MKFTSCALWALLAASAASGSTISYTVVDLGSPYMPRAINSSGIVVGRFESSDGNSFHAFEYANGVFTDLGTNGGSSGSTSEANGINDAGQVTGSVEQTGQTSRAFLYSNGTMGIIGPVGQYSIGYAVNNSGQISGETTQFANNASGFLYSSGAFQDLPFLGAGPEHVSNTYAYALNDSGQVTGYSRSGVGTANSSPHAFLYSGGTMFDLGVLPGTADANGISVSYGRAINNSAQVAGDSDGDAFLYSNGAMHDLGRGVAYGINNSGQVVGFIATSGPFAFSYNNGVRTDLNSLIDPASGWILEGANAINDSGEIVGTGLSSHGLSGFLLIPTGTPEPGAFWLMAGGSLPLFLAGGMGRRFWKFRCVSRAVSQDAGSGIRLTRTELPASAIPVLQIPPPPARPPFPAPPKPQAHPPLQTHSKSLLRRASESAPIPPPDPQSTPD